MNKKILIIGGLVGLLHVSSRAGLDGADGLSHLLGGGHGFLGELAHLVGHHGEASSGLAGPGRLDGGVQGQEVGLVRDVAYHLKHLANVVGLGA